MRRNLAAATGVAAASMLSLAVAGAPPAAAFGLGEAAEAEAARHHALAGGPTNYRDAELLARYGCFDKTDSDYCWSLYEKQRGRARWKKKYDRGR